MEEHKHVHEQSSPDSLEIGTPGKGGALKVYGNFNNVEDFKKKINNAVEVRKYAIAEIGATLG